MYQISSKSEGGLANIAKNWLPHIVLFINVHVFQVNVARHVVLFAQLRGSSRMHVLPNSPCNASCHTLYATLHKGEIRKFNLITVYK